MRDRTRPLESAQVQPEEQQPQTAKPLGRRVGTSGRACSGALGSVGLNRAASAFETAIRVRKHEVRTTITVEVAQGVADAVRGRHGGSGGLEPVPAGARMVASERMASSTSGAGAVLGDPDGLFQHAASIRLARKAMPRLSPGQGGRRGGRGEPPRSRRASTWPVRCRRRVRS